MEEHVHNNIWVTEYLKTNYILVETLQFDRRGREGQGRSGKVRGRSGKVREGQGRSGKVRKGPCGLREGRTLSGRRSLIGGKPGDKHRSC